MKRPEIRALIRATLRAPEMDAALRTWADNQRAVTKQVEDLHRIIKDAIMSIGSGKSHNIHDLLAALPNHLFRLEHVRDTGRPDLADRYDLPSQIVKADREQRQSEKFSFERSAGMWYLNTKSHDFKALYLARCPEADRAPQPLMDKKMAFWN